MMSSLLQRPIISRAGSPRSLGLKPALAEDTGCRGHRQGGLVIAGTAAYCVGNLHITGYELPWEDKSFNYPPNLASPLDIEIQASNGASDYGNKFGNRSFRDIPVHSE